MARTREQIIAGARARWSTGGFPEQVAAGRGGGGGVAGGGRRGGAGGLGNWQRRPLPKLEKREELPGLLPLGQQIGPVPFELRRAREGEGGYGEVPEGTTSGRGANKYTKIGGQWVHTPETPVGRSIPTREFLPWWAYSGKPDYLGVRFASAKTTGAIPEPRILSPYEISQLKPYIPPEEPVEQPSYPSWLQQRNAQRIAAGYPPQTEEEARAQIASMMEEAEEDTLAREEFEWEKEQAALELRLYYEDRARTIRREAEIDRQRYVDILRSDATEAKKAEALIKAREDEQAHDLEISVLEREAAADLARLERELRWEEIKAQAALQRERLAAEQQMFEMQLEAQRQERLATLRANPASWLEYAALSGVPPAIQPWMLPLAPEEYGFELGGAIPGWSPEAQGMGLQELATPSAQYLARMSPSARQQFAGYRGARTGQTAADIQYQLWAGAPPGGGYGGLRQVRYQR